VAGVDVDIWRPFLSQNPDDKGRNHNNIILLGHKMWRVPLQLSLRAFGRIRSGLYTLYSTVPLPPSPKEHNELWALCRVVKHSSFPIPLAWLGESIMIKCQLRDLETRRALVWRLMEKIFWDNKTFTVIEILRLLHLGKIYIMRFSSCRMFVGLK